MAYDTGHAIKSLRVDCWLGCCDVVTTWMGDCLRTDKPSQHIINYQGQLSLPPQIDLKLTTDHSFGVKNQVPAGLAYVVKRCEITVTGFSVHVVVLQIFELLKSTISRSYRDAERCRLSRWVHDLVPLRTDVAEQVLDTIKNRSDMFLVFTLA